MKPVLIALIGLAALLAGLAQQQEALANVHCMRIWAVMGGPGGPSSIEFVELRMSNGGQIFTNNSQLHFFNDIGAETGTFTLTAATSTGGSGNVVYGHEGASILIGTAAFDTAWTAGTPDFIMPANVVAPAGKVTFGPSGGPNCVTEANFYDSVSYGGANYTGTTDYGNPNSEQLPVDGIQALQLQTLTNNQTDNEDEYMLQANPEPCRNAPELSPICGPIGLPNTPTGTNVQVSPDPAVTVTFAQVTSSGNTTLTTSSTGPTPPSGFSLGTPTVYYEVATTATFTGTVTVCVNYDDQFVTEAGLNLFHHDGIDWTDVTTSLDTAGNEVCGQVTGFSPFLVALPDEDGDDISDLIDNCLIDPNGPAEAGISGVGNQTNTDADVLAAGGWKQNGVVMTGDSLGDACDPDDDNDFFSDVEEQRIYASSSFAAEQLVPCVSPGNPDPWPLDVSPPGAPDTGIDTGDVLLVLGFVGLFTASPGFDPRLDISLPAGGIDTTEVLFVLGFVGFFCTPP